MQVLDPQNYTVNSYQHIIVWQPKRTCFSAIWLAKKWFNNIKRFTLLLLQANHLSYFGQSGYWKKLLSLSIFRHWSTKQKIHEHRKSCIWSFDEFHIRFLLYVSLWKWWWHIINSLLTRLLARSILRGTWMALTSLGHTEKWNMVFPCMEWVTR